ncbi:MAG: hypothetical protein HY867_03420 [Chloroflexi bacterium]|nr:hypothetical protein [Chloroflexota bacterium]
MEKTILALHPDPTKQGVQIEKSKYDVVRSAIIAMLKSNGSMSFTDLGNAVEDRLRKSFDGSILWYYTTVKLDLEARKEIRRVPKTSPQMIELAG